MHSASQLTNCRGILSVSSVARSHVLLDFGLICIVPPAIVIKNGEVNRMANQMMSVQTSAEMQNLVTTYIAQGYQVQISSPQMTSLTKGGGVGSILLHIVWLCVLPVIANFIYYIYRQNRKEIVTISVTSPA